MRVVVGLLVGGALAVAALSLVPRHVSFSFASERTCTGRLSILPHMWWQTDDDVFRVQQEGIIEVGGVPVLSTRSCIAANAVPAEGVHITSMLPFGWSMLARPLAIRVASVPAPNGSALKKPVPVTKSLTINLSDIDRVSRYQMMVGTNSTTCTSHVSEPSLECDLAPLQLEPDQKYQIAIIQSIGAGSTEVLKDNITTLDAVTVKNSSITNDQVVYSKPKDIVLETNKPLLFAQATLADSETSEAVDIDTKIEGSTITVSFKDELSRGKKYDFRLVHAEAEDGSSLLKPYGMQFSTSTGPAVTGVSIQKYGVLPGSRVVVSLDQPLSADQDITKLVSTAGIGSTVVKSGSQIVLTLAGGGACTPFTIKVEPGLVSEHDIPSKAGWQYSSRTLCQTTSVYGYSVNGRPLVAYYFGSAGPVTMYVGAIHGNEPSSSGLMKVWINDLEANPSLYEGKRIVIVPTVNPDGIAAGTRDNAHGINLNRNFPTDNWKTDVNDTDGFKPGGGGSAPLSEPEANALANLTLQLRPRLMASFHAIGSLVVGDPGGVSAGYAAAYARSVGYADYTYRSSPFNYDTFGGYEDWTYSKLGIPSMIVELSSYGYYNFGQHQAALRMLLN